MGLERVEHVWKQIQDRFGAIQLQNGIMTKVFTWIFPPLANEKRQWPFTYRVLCSDTIQYASHECVHINIGTAPPFPVVGPQKSNTKERLVRILTPPYNIFVFPADPLRLVLLLLPPTHTKVDRKMVACLLAPRAKARSPAVKGGPTDGESLSFYTDIQGMRVMLWAYTQPAASFSHPQMFFFSFFLILIQWSGEG